MGKLKQLKSKSNCLYSTFFFFPRRGGGVVLKRLVYGSYATRSFSILRAPHQRTPATGEFGRGFRVISAGAAILVTWVYRILPFKGTDTGVRWSIITKECLLRFIYFWRRRKQRKCFGIVQKLGLPRTGSPTAVVTLVVVAVVVVSIVSRSME